MATLPQAVVFVSPDFPPAFGGIQRTTERLATVAHEVGVRVAVVAAATNGDTAYDAMLPYAVYRYRSGSLLQSIFASAAQTRRAARAIGADRIVAMLWSPPGLATALLRLAGMKIPVTILAHGTDIAKQNSTFRKMLLRAVFADADVAANSRFTAGLLKERRIVGARIVNPGADPVERTVGSRASVPTIMSAGRLVPRKGQDRVIAAIARLRPRIGDVKLLIVGEGPDRARLEALARELGVSDHVEFRGRVGDADLARCYAEAWCFAMPNRAEQNDVEGFGLVFLEAALHGLAAIGGRNSGADDAIVEGETGYLVDGNDVDGLVEALERLLSDRNLADALGAAGEARAVRDFTWHRYAMELLRQ